MSREMCVSGRSYAIFIVKRLKRTHGERPRRKPSASTFFVISSLADARSAERAPRNQRACRRRQEPKSLALLGTTISLGF